MANNDISNWADDYVSINDANFCSKSVRFGDLLPYLQAKPDVFEAADHYTYTTPSGFVSAYESNHYNMGYGDFRPDI